MFEQLRFNRKYIIMCDYPHKIYKLKPLDKFNKLCEEHIDKDGYVRVLIEGVFYYKHMVVAAQWLNYKIERKGKGSFVEVVDHIDRNRSNCNINNLRIIPQWENRLNNSRAGVEWLELDESKLKIPFDDENTYGIYRLDLDERKLYYTNTKQYKLLTAKRKKDEIYELFDNFGKLHEVKINDLIARYD